MLYRLSKTRNQYRRLYVLGTVGVCIVGLVVFHIPFPRTLSYVTHVIASPFLHVRGSITDYIHAYIEQDNSYESLMLERDTLKKELARVRDELYVSEALRNENMQLQELLGHTQEHEGSIPASVIVSPAYSPYDLFSIDVGTHEGVRDNMLVLSSEGAALGFIRETRTTSAIVSLFSAPGVKTDALLNGTTSNHIFLEGQGGSMKFNVPRGMLIIPGTHVTMPNFTGATIGTIVYVHTTPEDAFETVYVSPPENIYSLKHVLVDTTHIWFPPVPQPVETVSTQ